VLASEITESLSTLPAPAHQAWNDSSDKSLDQAFDDLMRFGAEAVVVQFNFGFYALPVLEAFARRVKQAGLPLVIEMHAVQMAREGFPGETLASQPGLWDVVDRVLLHTTQDMNLLAGFVDPLKLTLFPHASFAGEERSMAEVRRHLDLADHHPVIATYGFFLPGKGLDTAIDVHQQILARYPNALLLMVNAEYPSPVSRAEIERVESIICSRGLEDSVIMLTQYLSNEDSQILLQAADVVILPYAPSKESASGSVRRAMAAGRPVVVSDQSIFGDLSSIVATADARQPATFADTVLQVLGDPRRTANIVSRQEKWMRDHAPTVLSERLFGMITGLALDAKIPSGATTHDSAADKPAKKRPVEVAGSSRAATPAKRPRRRSIDAAE
jgi:glycosyltransferase involved in cell wall biosynthesis